MTKHQPTLVIALMLDFFALSISFLLYVKIRESIPIVQFSEQIPLLFLPMMVVSLFWVGLFWLFGLYRTSRFASRYEQVSTVFQAVSTGAIFLFLLIYIDDIIYEQDSGIVLTNRARFGALLYALFLFVFVAFGRVVHSTAIRKNLVRGIGRRNALIIGAGSRAKELAEDIAAHPALGVNVVGFVKDFSANSLPTLDRVFGDISTINAVISEKNVSDVIIAAEVNKHDELLKMIGLCEGKGVSLKILPDMYEIVSGAAKTTQIYGLPLVDLDPKLLSPLEENLKRIFDVLLSIAVLILGLPFWIIIALLVWIDTRSSPIYKQIRVGLHGKHFWLYKFRSMRPDAESSGPKLTQKSDDRITPLGKILRKYRIDEFPQFFNVLIGEMSIVGPRPERPFFIEKIIEQAPHYTRLHRVKPGITSWGQVKYGYAANIDEMVDRLKYDLFYIENISFSMDLKIILATIYVVITGRGQ